MYIMCCVMHEVFTSTVTAAEHLVLQQNKKVLALFEVSHSFLLLNAGRHFPNICIRRFLYIPSGSNNGLINHKKWCRAQNLTFHLVLAKVTLGFWYGTRSVLVSSCWVGRNSFTHVVKCGRPIIATKVAGKQF